MILIPWHVGRSHPLIPGRRERHQQRTRWSAVQTTSGKRPGSLQPKCATLLICYPRLNRYELRRRQGVGAPVSTRAAEQMRTSPCSIGDHPGCRSTSSFCYLGHPSAGCVALRSIANRPLPPDCLLSFGLVCGSEGLDEGSRLAHSRRRHGICRT